MGPGDFSDKPSREEAARLILKGISMLVQLAEQMKADDLAAKLILARDEALRELALLTAADPPAH